MKQIVADAAQDKFDIAWLIEAEFKDKPELLKRFQWFCAVWNTDRDHNFPSLEDGDVEVAIEETRHGG